MNLAPGMPTRNEPALATLERDEEGLLLAAGNWHPDLIEVVSGDVGLAMTPERRGVIDCARHDFEINTRIQELRFVLNQLQAARKNSKATCRDLCQLINRGYGQQSAESPARCIPHKLILDV